MFVCFCYFTQNKGYPFKILHVFKKIIIISSIDNQIYTLVFNGISKYKIENYLRIDLRRAAVAGQNWRRAETNIWFRFVPPGGSITVCKYWTAVATTSLGMENGPSTTTISGKLYKSLFSCDIIILFIWFLEFWFLLQKSIML